MNKSRQLLTATPKICKMDLIRKSRSEEIDTKLGSSSKPVLLTEPVENLSSCQENVLYCHQGIEKERSRGARSH